MLQFTGANLPFDSYRIRDSTLVTSPTNKGVILIGGSKGSQRIPFLYELSGNSEENLTWSLLDQKLSTAREKHVSFPIPNNCIPYLT